MSFLIVPIFCASVGFVVYMGAAGILSYVRSRSSGGSHGSRRERKASKVIGVAVGLGLAMNMLGGSVFNAGVWMIVDFLILLVTAGWVWRILTA